MKITRFFIFCLVLVSSFHLTAFAEIVQVEVKGMVCSLCAQGIKKNMLKTKKVETVDVDLDKKLVTIEVKNQTQFSDSEINTIITEAGYNVSKIERR